MIDATTRKPLTVLTDGPAGPYLIVRVVQLDDVRRLFDENRVHYTIQENTISLSGRPAVAFVDLGRGADAHAVQALLDSVGRG